MLKWVWIEGPQNKLSSVWCSFSAWINNAPVRQLDASASTVSLAWVSGVSKYYEVKLKALSAKRKIICCLWPGETLFSHEQEFLPKQSGAAHGLRDPFRLSPSYFIFTSASLHCLSSCGIIDCIPLPQHMNWTELSWDGSWIWKSTPGVAELPLFQGFMAQERAQRAGVWCKCWVPDFYCSWFSYTYLWRIICQKLAQDMLLSICGG